MFFFKQKTAYEMRISDWSSDVCSSDLSPSVSPPGCHLPMASPQGGIQAATGPPRSTQSRFRFLQLPAPASPAMLHRTRREGLEGKFCSTDVEIGRASCRERVCQYV